MVASEDAGPEGSGRAVQKLASLFYADNGLLVSLWPDRLQESLDTLTGLFHWVRLQTNVEKMVGII